MIFLPHTNTVILLEPYRGTITEPGLPVVKVLLKRFHLNSHTVVFHPQTKKLELHSKQVVPCESTVEEVTPSLRILFAIVQFRIRNRNTEDSFIQG